VLTASYRVVKIGGRAQTDPTLATTFAASVQRGDRICLVHGGGDEVSVLQRRLGLEPSFLDGRRVTSAADLEVVRMVLSGATNKRLTAQLIGAGIRAVGISGEDGGLFRARVTDPRLGRVGGEIAVDPGVVVALMAAGFTPVISPLARDADDTNGAGLNVNGDDAAAALAAALSAEDLVLVADVPGVLRDSAMVPVLDREAAKALVATGVATGGMTAKLDAAQRALDAGVPCVRIADIRGIADRHAGTRIVPSPTATR
jgi:acetylglutamate kinase